LTQLLVLTRSHATFRRNTEAVTDRLLTAGAQAATGPIMLKVIAVSFFVVALAACSSMSGRSTSMGNAAETKNSTDSNKAANPAAVSPGSSGSATGAAPR
jgi:hypothetical protein